MSDLFRREAVQHATRRLEGAVVLATPLSLKTLGFFLAADRSDNKEWRKAQDERLSVFADKIDATRSDVLVMRTR